MACAHFLYLSAFIAKNRNDRNGGRIDRNNVPFIRNGSGHRSTREKKVKKYFANSSKITTFDMSNKKRSFNEKFRITQVDPTERMEAPTDGGKPLHLRKGWPDLSRTVPRSERSTKGIRTKD